VIQATGALELMLILAFVTGLWKFWTYGAVLVLHAISTLSSYAQYLDPFNHLLFFAAWPMLAACFALFWLRDLDTIGTVAFPRRSPPDLRD
jgi:putative oxidoreductase